MNSRVSSDSLLVKLCIYSISGESLPDFIYVSPSDIKNAYIL